MIKEITNEERVKGKMSKKATERNWIIGKKNNKTVN